MYRSTLRRRVAASLTAALASATLVTTAIPASAAAPDARATDDSCPDGKTPVAGFDDTDGTTHESAIDCVVAWDVAKGKTADEYRPAEPVQRDQMATFIVNLLREAGVTLPTDSPDEFPDDEHSVHEDNIDILADLGIVKGDREGLYQPFATVQRDQMATFLNGAYAEITGAALTTSEDFFADDDGNVHEDNINGVASVGITGGTSGGGYSPKADVNRGAMASFIARQLDVLVEEGETFPPFLQPGLNPDPADTRTPISEAYTVTFTLVNEQQEPIANQAVDIHVITNDTTAKVCEPTDEADDNSTGSSVCEIDALDPLTDSQGQVTFSYQFVGDPNGERVHRVLAFTGSLGATYTTSSGLKGEAISRWIEEPASVLITAQSPTEATYGSQTAVTVQLVDDDGQPVPLDGEQVIFTVHRDAQNCAVPPFGGTRVHGPDVAQTDAKGTTRFSYVGPTDPDPTASSTTTDCLVATYDADADGTRDTTEDGEAEERQYSDEGGTAAPGQFDATPDVDTKTVNGQHVVQATVRDDNGALLADQDVLFRVYRNTANPSSSSSTVQSGYRSTNANGVATFAYFGPSAQADDIIVVCLDDDRDGCGGFTFVNGSIVAQEADTTEAVRMYWMVTATATTPDGATESGTIRGFATAADRIDAEIGSDNKRFTYDSNDDFFVDGVEVTLSQFEAALEDNTSLEVDYDPASAATSIFKIS